MNDFYDDIFSENLATYKLTDSSYIVAEEVEIDKDTGSIYVANPLEMIREKGGMRLKPWIIVETDGIVELNSANIICRTEVPNVISKYYLKYIAYDKLINNVGFPKITNIISNRKHNIVNYINIVKQVNKLH